MSKRQLTIKFQKQASTQLSQLIENRLPRNSHIRDTLEVLVANHNNEIRDKNKRISLKNVLECISEPETYYHQNDAVIDHFGQDQGNKIYSPRIDLCIAPSFVKINEKKGRCLMNILMPEGTRPSIYESFEQVEIIKKLKQQFEEKSKENYAKIGIEPISYGENKSPLYLFGIEIENNLNSKHLMGDFINSYMLSKNPIVLIPTNKLDFTLNLLKYVYTIEALKGIDFRCLSRVNILTIKQFTEIVNILLREHHLQEIQFFEDV